MRDSPSWPPPAGRPVGDRVAGRPLEHLAQDPLLDAGDAMDLPEGLVAPQRVGDVADGRHDGLDEADPPGRGLEVEPRRRDGR